MKKTILVVFLFTLVGFSVFANHVRVGFISVLEFDEKPVYETVVEEYHAGDNVFPGFYWEVIPHHIGYGMTGNVRFDRQESPVPEVDYQWYMDWIATWDFRYHPLRWSFIDPFASGRMGSQLPPRSPQPGSSYGLPFLERAAPWDPVRTVSSRRIQLWRIRRISVLGNPSALS